MRIIQFVLALTVLMSCSESADKQDGPDDPGTSAPAITLKSDRAAVLANGEDKITLSVVDGEGSDITEKCVFSANGITLAGAEFTADMVGEYLLKAVYGTAESNILTIKAVAKKEMAVQVDKETFSADGVDGAVLKLVTNLGEDLTGQTSFYIETTLVDGSFFSTKTPGKYTIRAEYNGEPAGLVNVTAVAGSNFVYRVLAEDHTSVTCFSCPKITRALERLCEENSRLVVVAWHSDYGTPDPMTKDPEVTELKKIFGIRAYPTVIIDRSQPWDEKDESLLGRLEQQASLGIALKSDVENGQVKLTAKVKSNQAVAGARYFAMLLENGLIYPQATSGPTADHFVHNRVLREVSSVVGQDMTVSAQNVTELSVTLPWKDSYKKENCIVVFCVLGANSQVVNVNEVKLGAQVGY